VDERSDAIAVAQVLLVALDVMGYVASLQARNGVFIERYVERCDCIFDVPGAGGANDDGVHRRSTEQPGKRDLCRRSGFLGGDLTNLIDDVEVRLVVSRGGKRIVGGAHCACALASLTCAGEQPTG
jgi:hypothetical protein